MLPRRACRPPIADNVTCIHRNPVRSLTTERKQTLSSPPTRLLEDPGWRGRRRRPRLLRLTSRHFIKYYGQIRSTSFLSIFDLSSGLKGFLYPDYDAALNSPG